MGDNITVEDICATKYLFIEDPLECASHLFEMSDPGFRSRIQPGEILVAGRMFPYGAPHLNAILAIKGAGFRAVIAQSGYSRFIRTCINFGLPYILISDADAIREGDELSIDLSAGIVADRTIGREFKFDPYPSFLIDLLAADGLKQYVSQRLAQGIETFVTRPMAGG